MSLACIVISSAKRLDLLLGIVQGIAEQGPDELLVVSDSIKDAGFPFLNVEPLTHTTTDALVKRDVGFVATTSDNICYLSDDHRLAPDFVRHFYNRYYWSNGDWDILVPSRFTVRDGVRIALPVGAPGERWTTKPYCAGHAGIYRRDCIRRLPFSAGPHDRNWDVGWTHQAVAKGARLVFAGQDLAVEDIEPNSRPWE